MYKSQALGQAPAPAHNPERNKWQKMNQEVDESLALFHSKSFVLSSSTHPQPVAADGCTSLSLVLLQVSSC